mgnify:CR=1 FL=1
MGRPKKIGKSKAKKDTAGKSGDDSRGHNSETTDRAIVALATEIEAIDEKIAGLRAKKKERLDDFKDQFGVSIDGFKAGYKDSRLEGAAQATKIADYLRTAKALGLLADLPLGEQAVEKMIAKAEKVAETARKKEAKEAEAAAAAETGADEQPPIGEGSDAVH